MGCGRSLMTLKRLLEIQEPNVEFIPGKVEALMEDMQKNGQKEPIVIYRDPRFKEEVLQIRDGSNRLEAARRLGWKTLEVRRE